MKDTEKIIKMLRSHRMGCFGCGYEHNCRDNGCALMQMAANELEKLTHHTEPENKLLTNGDLIRSMGNEELAVTLACPNEMGMAEIDCDHSDDKNCCQCLLDWLNQPCEPEQEAAL
jgi:hypothetical protein